MTRDDIRKMAETAGLAGVKLSAGLEEMRLDMWERFAALVAAAEREACKMEDIYVKCCRCKNKHWHSDRKESAPDKHGMKNLICPRCGGHSYYKLDDPAQATKGE